MKRKIIIGSRGSDLALWQANFLKKKLSSISINSEIKIIKTKGDIIQHISLTKVEGKGFFTKELEDALLKKEIDVAVHSYKDLPTALTPGLIIAANSEREKADELLLISKDTVDVSKKFLLKKNAVVGTSSPRRKSQLLAFRKDLKLKDLRGNVPTRIQKLRDKKYDAILIAYAGVSRLKINLDDFFVEKIPPEKIIPAPAQGVLAYEIRKNDFELKRKLQKIHSKETEEVISVERKVLQIFQGGCQIPVGVYCKKENGKYLVWAAKANEWNDFPTRAFLSSKKKIRLAERAVEKISSRKLKKKIFISRDLEKDSYLKNALTKYGCKVFGKSLVDFSAVKFKRNIPKTDWLFFSSKNSVKYFFAQKPILPTDIKFAVMGEGTKEALNKIGYPSDLTGFKNLSGLVLFPRAKNSLRTVQKAIAKKAKAIDLIVYENEPKEKFKIPHSDILIFTSPMNAETYLKKYSLTKKQTVIAIGKTTEKKLKELGCPKVELPYSPDEIALADVVRS